MASDRSGSWRRAAEALVIPIAALAAAMVMFGIFMAALGQNPLEIYALIYRGALAADPHQGRLRRQRPAEGREQQGCGARQRVLPGEGAGEGAPEISA